MPCAKMLTCPVADAMAAADIQEVAASGEPGGSVRKQRRSRKNRDRRVTDQG